MQTEAGPEVGCAGRSTPGLSAQGSKPPGAVLHCPAGSSLHVSICQGLVGPNAICEVGLMPLGGSGGSPGWGQGANPAETEGADRGTGETLPESVL